MGDLLIYSTGSGGDANQLNNDFEITEGLFNMVFLAMFGGNPGYNTGPLEVASEQNFDYWGNSLVFKNNPEAQFNSYTENTLNTIAITSESRQIIKGFVLKDLDFLSNLAKIEVEVYLLDANKVEIQVKVNELTNLQNKEFQFIWDGTKSELIENRII